MKSCKSTRKSLCERHSALLWASLCCLAMRPVACSTKDDVAASGAYAELQSSLPPGCMLMTMEEVCSDLHLRPCVFSLPKAEVWDMPEHVIRQLSVSWLTERMARDNSGLQEILISPPLGNQG